MSDISVTKLNMYLVAYLNNLSIDQVHLRRTDESSNELVSRLIVQVLRSIYLLDNTILKNNDSISLFQMRRVRY